MGLLLIALICTAIGALCGYPLWGLAAGLVLAGLAVWAAQPF